MNINFWILLIYIGFFLNLTNGQSVGKFKSLNLLNCSAPARQIKATPTIRFGQNVPRGYYPWHSAIFKLDGQVTPVSVYLCGGTLISTATVLTAAHCLYEEQNLLSANIIVVRLNVQNINFDGEAYRVFEIIPHKHFNEDNLHHDIALLKLRTTVTFNDFKKPACITNKRFNIVDVVGFVSYI